jgi:hypothetical protein
VDTGKPCLRIYVSKKVPAPLLSGTALVPKTVIDDTIEVPTDVIEVGDVKALPFLSPDIATNPLAACSPCKLRPVVGGASISPGNFALAGTGGLVVYKHGVLMLLSNNHVLRMSFISNEAERPQRGMYVRQPAFSDGGTIEDNCGIIEDYIEMSFPGPNEADCALARIAVGISPEINGVGVPSKIITPVKDMPVTKSGRTSGITSGTITDTDVTIQVNYSSNPNTPILATLTGQILTTPMLQPGDSGSVLVNLDNLSQEIQVAALGFAGSDLVSVATPIEKVFSLLDLTLPKAVKAAEALSQIKGSFTCWAYDAISQKWICYDSAALEYVNDLYCLISGQGYWIKVEQEQSLVYKDYSCYLRKGWNLIGWI